MIRVKIIDAHMHFARFPGFDEVAHHAGHEIRQPITLQPAMKMALS